MKFIAEGYAGLILITAAVALLLWVAVKARGK